MNALDSALVRLYASISALEHHAPTTDDVETAKDSAKAAAKILDSAFTLMSCGIYSVAEPPVDSKYVDPAAHKIEMPEVAHIELDVPAELPPMPVLFGEDFLEDTPEGRKVAFESALEDLDGKGMDANPEDSTDWDDAAWWAAFDSDPLSAWHKLMFSIYHRDPFNFEVPTDEEFATWRAQFAPDPTPDEPVAEELPASPKTTLAEFQADLDRLEEAGVEQGLKRKDWKKANNAWWVAHDQDPLGTYSKLARLLAAPAITSWAVPEDEDPFETEGDAQ